MRYRTFLPTLVWMAASCSGEVSTPPIPEPPRAGESAAAVLSAQQTALLLRAGDPAPDLDLPDQDDVPWSLASLRGARWAVVAFYPRAGTPG